MGNTESTSFIGKNVNPSEYQLVGKVHNVRWGELFEMNHIRARKLVFMQEKHSNTLEKHQKLARLCAQRMTLSHRNLAVIYGAASNNTPDVFTNTYKACIFFEHLPQSLQTLIDNKTFHYSKQTNFRQSTRLPDYFESAQILSLIHEFVNAFGYLQKNGICQGDITPDVCFISEDGTPKVLEKAFLFHDDSAIDTAMRSNLSVFLTPAELETIANQDVPLTEDRFKADVFRLGMTLLECATLKKSSQIYNWDDYIIDMDVISSRLAEVQDRYSPEVYEKLREMLRLEERRRPDFISLSQQVGQPRQTPNPRDYVSSKSLGQLHRPQKEPLAKSMTNVGIGPKLTAHVPIQTEKYPKSTLNTDSRGYNNQQRYSVQRQNKGNASRRENLRDEDIEEFDDTARINRVPHIDPYNASFENSKERSLNASSIMQHRDSIRHDEYDDDDGSQSNTTVKSLSLSRPSVKHNNSMERDKISFHNNNFHTASPQRSQQKNATRPGFDIQQWKQTNAQNPQMMKSPQNSSQNRQRNSIFTQGTGRSDFHHPQLIDLHNLPQPSKNARSTSQTPTARSQKPNFVSQKTTPPRVGNGNTYQNQKPSSHISLSKLNNWESSPAQRIDDDYSPRFATQQKNASFKAPANHPNEKDLVESILRNVMTHAGISPVKQPQKSSIAYTEDRDAERNFQRPQEADQQNYQPQAFSRSYYSSKTPTAKTSYLQRPDLSGGHQKYNSDNKPSNPGFENAYQSHKSPPGNHMSEIRNQNQYRTNAHTREPSNAVETGRMTHSKEQATPPEGDGVDNRFEMAMQRSQRSVGYMKNLARHMESSRSISTGGSAQKRFRQDDY